MVQSRVSFVVLVFSFSFYLFLCIWFSLGFAALSFVSLSLSSCVPIGYQSSSMFIFFVLLSVHGSCLALLCFNKSAVFLNNLLWIWVCRLCEGGRVKFPLPPIAPFSPGGPGIPSCPWFPLGPDGPGTPGGPVLPKYGDIIHAQWSVLRA